MTAATGEAKVPMSTTSTIPHPPSSTIQTSSEPPRTLWMGDLDPGFDEVAIQQIWAHLGKPVGVKLIRAKKNLLIPCSTSSTFSTSQNEGAVGAGGADAPQQGVAPQGATLSGGPGNKININGVAFIDPKTTQLHHAGYCFVEFETLHDAQWALTLNASPLPNIVCGSAQMASNPSGLRNFRLNWASGATLQSVIPSTPEFSLFVGDLSPTATEAHLLSLFQERFKSVKTVRVMTDPITGASRCFGFVRFGDEHERRRALVEMNGVWCQGRNLRVAYATPRNNAMWQVPQQPTTSATPANPQGFVSTAPSGEYGGPPGPQWKSTTSQLMDTANALLSSNPGLVTFRNHQDQYSHHQSGSLSYAKLPQNYSNGHNTTVFVGGLTPSISEQHLHSLFAPFGTLVSVKIPPGKGCGFVKYANRIDAEAAIQGMHGFIFGGNPIRLSWGRTSQDTHHPQRDPYLHQISASPRPLDILSYQSSVWNDYEGAQPSALARQRQTSDMSSQQNSVPPVHPSLL
ncbi:LAMI_0G09120g1_1 [Lachancea mirantina]|uniref:LAMI_0G09120g1_1 n=1 Tax=Lachancea mirantina TaxID=1230905 RepID=A0A1G4KA57_9SACH|nr:LAMI_0G09120g1_1 [Lachancea mirantina]